MSRSLIPFDAFVEAAAGAGFAKNDDSNGPAQRSVGSSDINQRDTVSPRNGQVLATVAQAGKDDLDVSVTAARRAFESEWRSFKPFDRQHEMLARPRFGLRPGQQAQPPIRRRRHGKYRVRMRV